MTTCSAALDALSRVQSLRITGRVEAVRGLVVMVADLHVPVGSLVTFAGGGRAVQDPAGGVLSGEVVGFSSEHAMVMLLGQTTGVRAGDRVVCEEVHQTCPVGEAQLGRVIDGLGRPVDGKGPVPETMARPLQPEPLRAMARRRISRALHTGVRAVDLMTTLGRGQRMGVFAGPGVGKSTLLGAIARGTAADVSVIALIGERGREVKDFIEHSLGERGLARSVIVVATGDESPLLRLRAAKVACSIAEYHRDHGRDVLLMMDSITRFAHAQRQVGLSVGEPPATKGYTPSVFAQLAQVLERAGSVEPEGQRRGGSITGLYSVLVEGDDFSEPICDAARGILDGHLMLSRKLAQRGHFPAVDVLDSISRVAEDVVTPEHSGARRQVLRMLALYREVEELVQIGAYVRGSNPECDVAIDFHGAITDLLKQGRGDTGGFEPALARLVKLAKDTGDRTRAATKGNGKV